MFKSALYIYADKGKLCIFIREKILGGSDDKGKKSKGERKKKDKVTDVSKAYKSREIMV